MDSKNIFTVTITGANNEVRTIVSDCLLVIAHNIESDDAGDFNMSYNNSSNGATTLMLVDAIDKTKQHILDSSEEIKALYEFVHKKSGEQI